MEVVTVHQVFQQEDKRSKLHAGEIFDLKVVISHVVVSCFPTFGIFPFIAS